MQPPNPPHPTAPSGLQRLWNSAPGLIFRRYPGLLGVPLVLFIATAFEGAITSGPILCVFRLGSGLPCAGCGMTRGFVAIAHGHVDVALQYNLFSPVLFTWMSVWWLMAVVRLWRGQRPWQHPPGLVKVAVVVLLGYWAIRASWFASQAGAWQDMVATSPVLRLIHWLLT